MESETGARINIRGKGSVRSWDKKVRDGHEDEPLHAYVTSTNPEAVKKAADKIRNVIKEIADMPEDQIILGRSSCI